VRAPGPIASGSSASLGLDGRPLAGPAFSCAHLALLPSSALEQLSRRAAGCAVEARSSKRLSGGPRPGDRLRATGAARAQLCSPAPQPARTANPGDSLLRSALLPLHPLFVLGGRALRSCPPPRESSTRCVSNESDGLVSLSSISRAAMLATHRVPPRFGGRRGPFSIPIRPGPGRRPTEGSRRVPLDNVTAGSIPACRLATRGHFPRWRDAGGERPCPRREPATSPFWPGSSISFSCTRSRRATSCQPASLRTRAAAASSQAEQTLRTSRLTARLGGRKQSNRNQPVALGSTTA